MPANLTTLPLPAGSAYVILARPLSLAREESRLLPSVIPSDGRDPVAYGDGFI